MKTGHIITLAFTALVLTFISVSCRSGKSSVTDNASGTTAVLTKKNAEKELTNLINGYTGWQTLKLPVTIRLREPKSISISGTAVMERDKSLTISLRFFGMEVGSLSVMSDSITVIDRINKAYFKDGVENLLDGFPANVGNLQNLLLGRVFVPGKDGVKTSDFEVQMSGEPGLWTASGMLDGFGVKYSYAFRSPAELKALAIRVNDSVPVTLAYGDFFSSTAGDFSTAVTIEALAGKSQIEASIEWNFKKAVWNASETVQDRSKIPSGYSRISPEAVVKMLKKL